MIEREALQACIKVCSRSRILEYEFRKEENLEKIREDANFVQEQLRGRCEGIRRQEGEDMDKGIQKATAAIVLNSLGGGVVPKG